MKWSDGFLYLMTDEGTNTQTTVCAKGKGTGGAQFLLRMGDSNNQQAYWKINDNVSELDFGSSITEHVVNQEGSDVDFRVESDTNANAFVVDAGTERVKIGVGLAGTPDEITATSDGVAASVNTVITEITTNGDEDLDNVTLANGTSGQIKHFVWTVAGNAADTLKITPATMLGGTQITFGAGKVGNGCTMIYSDNEGWSVIGHNGGTIA
jgi:hypothetical protein